MISKRPGPDGFLLVTFSIPAAVWAENVCLVGDFDGWSRYRPLTRSHKDDPHWQITLQLAPGRRYEFRYLLNGTTWCNDCEADDYVSNPYGGFNSVVQT